MKNDFVVENIGGKRWSVALELLEEGESFVHQDIRFSMDNKGKVIYCHVISPFTNPTNVTEADAIKHIKKAQEIVKVVCEQSNEFKSLTEECKIKYSLVSDYGTGIVPLYVLEGDSVRKCSANNAKE